MFYCRACEKEEDDETKILICVVCQSKTCEKKLKCGGGYIDEEGLYVCCDPQKLRTVKCKRCSSWTGLRTGVQNPYGAGFICELCGFWFCGTCMKQDNAVNFVKGKPRCVLTEKCQAEVKRMKRKQQQQDDE